jgi:simple sugar transport system permease protein
MKNKFDLGLIIRRPEFGAFMGLVFVYVFFAIFGGQTFTAVGGFASWMNIAAELGIIALPVGLIMIAGDLDLSVGSTLAAGGIMTAVLSGFYSLPTWIGIFAGIAFSINSKDTPSLLNAFK